MCALLKGHVNLAELFDQDILLGLFLACGLNALANGQHPGVRVRDDIRAVFELAHDPLFVVNPVLIFELVLQAGPKVHGNGADLYLHHHPLGLVGKKHRDPHNQVETAVAVGLWMGDIVLLGNQFNVVLLDQGLGQHIDIVHIGADHPDPGHVMDMRLYILQGKGNVQPVQLIPDAGGGFEPGADEFDRVALVPHIELGVQHVKFGPDLLHGTGIHHPQFLIGDHRVHHLF